MGRKIRIDLPVRSVLRVQQRCQPLLGGVELVYQQREAFLGDRRIGLPHRGHQFVEVAEHVAQLSITCAVGVGLHGGIELGRDAFAYQLEQVRVDSGQQAEIPALRLRGRRRLAQRGDYLLDSSIGRSIAVRRLRREPRPGIDVDVHLSGGGMLGGLQRRQPFRGGVEMVDE
ncbi:hypothetical protein ACWEPH_18490 [Nocardia beijingensis]